MSTLVQAMAGCCQATSHYLSQYWPGSMALLGHNGLISQHLRWNDLFQVVLHPGQQVPDGHTLLGGNVAVPAMWFEATLRKVRKCSRSGKERVKLLMDGLIRPQQLALFGGMRQIRNTYLGPLLRAIEGKQILHHMQSVYFEEGILIQMYKTFAVPCNFQYGASQCVLQKTTMLNLNLVSQIKSDWYFMPRFVGLYNASGILH